MRRRYLHWMITVFGLVGTIYGAYLLNYHFSHGNGLKIWALVLLILGVAALVLVGVLYIITLFQQNKRKINVTPTVEEKPEEEVASVVKEEEKPEQKQVEKEKEPVYEAPKTRETYSDYSSYSYSYSTVYVKQVGYGPVLRIEGPRIVDMRTNTYYRIENNNVMQDGYGIRFEIRGNQIRDAFGSYLYELSGSNINKVFGGFYASISGNYFTIYDLSMKYEMTDSLSKKQILVVAALLFGNY